MVSVKSTISEKKIVSFLRREEISTLCLPAKIDAYTCGDKYFDSFVESDSSIRF